jgi:hypothetical protein
MTQAASVLILTGAGAGPDISTRILTDELLHWRGLLEPDRSFLVAIRRRVKPEPLKSWLSRIDAKFRRDAAKRPFFQWLLDVSGQVYPNHADGLGFGYRPAISEPNFEELIHVVERLSYLLQEQYYDSPYKRPPPYEAPFIRLSHLGKVLKAGSPMSLYDIVIRASNFILDQVAGAAAMRPRVDAKDIITALRDKILTKVFSLNYDSRVIDLSLGWWTGFRSLDAVEAGTHDSKAGVEIFEPKAEIPSDEHAFIQLHGSTHFDWIAHYIAPRYVIARYPSPLLRHSTPRREGFDLWNDRSAMPSLGMITGFRKGEKILTEPYASYFHHFRQEAFRTPRWLIIGYGGNDPHVNAVLRSASDYWGTQLRAYVCNWLPESTIEDGSFHAAARQRVAFLGRTGYSWKPERANPLFDGELISGNQIRLTVDGAPTKHLSAISSFLSL